MQIYNFHPKTFVLLGLGDADQDPLNPGNWLLPAFSTEIAPPDATEGQRAIFSIDDQVWRLEPIPEVEPEQTPAIGESTPAELAATVGAMRDQLLQNAGLRIAPLQDAVDLGDATAEEQSKLVAWKQYRIALNRVTQQETFPQAVTWPTSPG
ncbi:tail fiber assembly protein [Herbaspirillum huttiense]|uniref:tail fiber assembly protein n=1 Tax=Herbaspirillum huttiense TaxID=863372 RepID=UPI00380B7047